MDQRRGYTTHCGKQQNSDVDVPKRLNSELVLSQQRMLCLPPLLCDKSSVLFVTSIRSATTTKSIIHNRPTIMLKGDIKPVKILKRPSQNATPPPSNPADKVSAEITSMLEACLNKERARLEAMYRARHDALLRVISDVLNQSLERLVSVAAKRETDNLMDAYLKLSATTDPEIISLPPIENDTVKSAREAFATAFEKIALPRFEESVALLLKDVANIVDKQVEERLVKPTSTVVNALEVAADSLRTARTEVAEMSIDSDASDLAAVQSALDTADVASALRLCIGKSDDVQTKAISGVLDLDVGPEDAFSEWLPPAHGLIKFASLLTMDLSDRTEARLRWLYEVVTLMDDVEAVDSSQEDVSKLRSLIEGTIERLTVFQVNGSPSPTEAKHAKLLNRVLKAHLKSTSILAD